MLTEVSPAPRLEAIVAPRSVATPNEQRLQQEVLWWYQAAKSGVEKLVAATTTEVGEEGMVQDDRRRVPNIQ
jgi:hypothetical protein